MPKKYELNSKTYFSPESNLKYLDCSTYKAMVGTPSRKGCEKRALAIAKGEYIQPKTIPLLVGSYVDAYFEGTLTDFLRENMDSIYTKASIKKCADGKGELELLSDFKQADVMIKRAVREPLFMKYMEGDKQVILTADIDGVPIRVKLDSYDGHRITDLKTSQTITKTFYAADLGERLNFAEHFGYIEQGYFYKEAVRQNFGKDLPFYLAVITKDKFNNEPHPFVKVIQIPDKVIEDKGKEIRQKIHSVWSVLQGEVEPIGCGVCEYCADHDPCELITLDELLLEV